MMKLNGMRIYFIVSISTVVFLTIILKLYNTTLDLPLRLGGDTAFGSSTIKGMIDNGWYLQNYYLGAPFTANSFDFPIFDSFNMLIIRIITFIYPNWAIGLNIFYILTFILVAITSTYVLKKLEFSDRCSLLGALIYTFLPYHFYRGVNHLFLSAYYMVPISVLICIMLVDGCKNNINTSKGVLNDKIFLVSLLVIGTTGIYYAYFTCFFIAVSFLYKTLNLKKLHKTLVINTFVSTIFIVLGCLLNIIPNIIFWISNGSGTIVHRGISAIEMYGLKISQLLMPIPGHRISLLARVRNIFDQNAILQNENSAAVLGTLMSIGFICLILCLFFETKRPKLKFIGVLNISAVLLATVGGFSGIIAVLFTSIRTYNRISVFIAFFCVIALCSVLSKLEKYFETKNFYGLNLIFVIILLVALFDQTSPSFIPNYEAIKSEYANDKNFVEEIESTIPSHSMIFQLPYMPFPESRPINNMSDYSHLKGYLHSNHLRWSYGAMKGRMEDEWIKNTAAMPIDEMIETISIAGFRGVYVDRYAYLGDELVDLENKLKQYSEGASIESINKRLVFYDLEPYTQSLKRNLGEDLFGKKQYDVLHPIHSLWTKGFSGLESANDYVNNWRWCNNKGNLELYNPRDEAVPVRLSGILATGHSEYSTVTIKSADFEEIYTVNSDGTYFEINLLVRSGKSVIEFHTDAPQVIAPNDPRNLYFRIRDANIEF